MLWTALLPAVSRRWRLLGGARRECDRQGGAATPARRSGSAATLRGDNELIAVGPGSNMQENSVLHTDLGFPLTIGANCTIGHKAMLHGCTIGDDSR